MTSKRAQIAPHIVTELLTRSRRRCALCFGLDDCLEERAGQIAHVDQKSSNPALDNLVWLCLEHHDRYDSRTSQSKGITKGEVLRYRAELYDVLNGRQAADVSTGQVRAEPPPPDLRHGDDISGLNGESAPGRDAASGWRVRYVVRRSNDALPVLERRWKLLRLGVHRKPTTALSRRNGLIQLTRSLDSLTQEYLGSSNDLLGPLTECMGPDDNVNSPEDLVDAVNAVLEWWQGLTDQAERAAALGVRDELCEVKDAIVVAHVSVAEMIADLFAQITALVEEFEPIAADLEEDDIAGAGQPFQASPVLKVAEPTRRLQAAKDLLRTAKRGR